MMQPRPAERIFTGDDCRWAVFIVFYRRILLLSQEPGITETLKDLIPYKYSVLFHSLDVF